MAFGHHAADHPVASLDIELPRFNRVTESVAQRLSMSRPLWY